MPIVYSVPTELWIYEGDSYLPIFSSCGTVPAGQNVGRNEMAALI